MKLQHCLFIAVAALHSLSASAATTSYECRFSIEASPRGLSKKDTPFELRFVVDIATNKGYLLGNNGSAEVEIIQNTNGVSFVEITRSGNIMVTAIAESGDAVHSRNGIFADKLVPSQLYGKCVRS